MFAGPPGTTQDTISSSGGHCGAIGGLLTEPKFGSAGFGPKAPAGSTAGLPSISYVSAGGGQMRLRLEYLRRTGAGITYTPEFGSSPTNLLPAVNAPVVTPVAEGWERCVVMDSAAFPASPRLFARVRVTW